MSLATGLQDVTWPRAAEGLLASGTIALDSSSGPEGHPERLMQAQRVRMTSRGRVSSPVPYSAGRSQLNPGQPLLAAKRQGRQE